MSNYQPHWDLSTIPEPEWNSEHGRRNRAKGPAVTSQKFKPCSGCGNLLNATQARKPCLYCGRWHSRKEWAGK